MFYLPFVEIWDSNEGPGTQGSRTPSIPFDALNPRMDAIAFSELL
jgi:hypothetical protein